MANFAVSLKEEIARLVRKELRRETEQFKKTSAHHRTEIAALKRRITDLEKTKPAKPARDNEPNKGVEKQIRFSPTGFKNNLKKLSLSAGDAARLFDVSTQTIYNWCSLGGPRPRQDQLDRIAKLRTLKKNQIEEILAAMPKE